MRILINAAALWVAAWALDGIRMAEGGDASTTSKVVTVLLVALVFGLVNAVIKPVAKVLSFPVTILTLGLFIFIVNAFMLQITSWLSGALSLDFHVRDFFWDAILGALIVSVVSWALNFVLPEKLEGRR